MKAIQEDNVNVHFTAAKALTDNCVVGEDGVEREVDTVVCATGFDTSYRPRFPIVGKGGINMQDQWNDEPDAYYGITVPNVGHHIILDHLHLGILLKFIKSPISISLWAPRGLFTMAL
ncbi:uncharacterized protein EAE98_010831 [Botrytis deweyae]|uniref:Uncharacterized protein n=1 Tax=Botrytis deweyae TaxID=2478750 RepID=A0ABQ7I7W2_9HELO|nr:uncharacterized protein EAE98_010831 [Botrytis deweyae]KAF7916246.1 hypothetical protein EAE98_010831 [Botrytis deweyae]